MKKDRREPYAAARSINPPEGLREKIIDRIARERRMARVRLLSFGGLALAAAIGVIPAWQEFISEVSQSGFSQFVSLLFSDGGAVLGFWQDFALSLAESFPVLGTAALLGSVFIFLYALRQFVRDAAPVLRRSRLVRA